MELENKIEGILTRLSSGDSLLQQPSNPFIQVSKSPYPPSANTTFEIPLKLPNFQFSNVVFDGFQDSISKGYVSFEQAELSLQAFQAQASNFPFVVVDPTIGLDILRRKRPFLLLSILTYAASWNLSLQRQLETELKASLCKKVIMDGEKSLDLLQGLLVYLNWLVSQDYEQCCGGCKCWLILVEQVPLLFRSEKQPAVPALADGDFYGS